MRTRENEGEISYAQIHPFTLRETGFNFIAVAEDFFPFRVQEKTVIILQTHRETFFECVIGLARPCESFGLGVRVSCPWADREGGRKTRRIRRLVLMESLFLQGKRP